MAVSFSGDRRRPLAAGIVLEGIDGSRRATFDIRGKPRENSNQT